MRAEPHLAFAFLTNWFLLCLAGFIAMLWGISKTRKEWAVEKYVHLDEETELGQMVSLELSQVGHVVDRFGD